MIDDQYKVARRQRTERLAVAGSVISAKSSIIERRLRNERRILVGIYLLLPAVALSLWWWAR